MIQQLDNMASATVVGTQSSTAGTVMKSTVTNSSIGSGLGWNPAIPASPGTNTSGFSALPGGLRNFDGSFYDIRDYAFFWSATEYGGNFAWFRGLYNYGSGVTRGNDGKSVGASVRCLRD